jgi:predicted O-methyltransferase YrrM
VTHIVPGRAGKDTASAEHARSLVQRIVVSLESITGLERIWKRGVVHRGGPHYRLRGTIGPVSIGEDECFILARLISRFRPAHCFVIGNGFGLSSAFIAKMMEANGGMSVVTLDSKVEGDGERCFETAEQLRIRMDCRILRNEHGVSPQDINKIGGSRSYDLIFIDGDHSHPQATRDFRGVQHLLRQDGVLLWHDYWLAGVSESVAEARQSGYRCVKVNSSCEMAFGTRNEAVSRDIEALFDDAETPSPRSHPWARFMLSRSFLWATFTSHLRSRARR